MKHSIQYEEVKVQDFATDRWEFTICNKNYHELLFISDGEGQHRINNTVFGYKRGDIFILGPGDHHFFTIHRKTRIISLTFTDEYILRQKRIHTDWLEHVSFLPGARMFKFDLADIERLLAERIFELMSFISLHTPESQPLLSTQINALGDILKRSMAEQQGEAHKITNNNIKQLFFYIHINICNPKNLRACVLAKQFNTSENYIGKFFKRNVGISLRGYIHNYRKHQIEKRLEENCSVKEVVTAFGLTDESHLRKIRMSGKKK